jgi:hypothetical protein
MFDERPQMVMAESSDGGETIRPAAINERRSLEVAGCAREDKPLLIAEQGQIGISEQGHGAEIWQLLFDFGKAVGRLLAKLSTCRWAYTADISDIPSIFCWSTKSCNLGE